MSYPKNAILFLLVCIIALSACGCGGGGGSVRQNPIDIDPGDPNPNQAPTITSIAPNSSSSQPVPMKAGDVQLISVSAADPDNDPLTYTWSTNNGNVTSVGSQEANYTAPGSAGTAIVTVTVSDGKHTPVSANVYFLIENADNTLPTNSPPTVILSANPTKVAAGGTSTITATTSDPDGDTLACTWIINGGTIQTKNDDNIVWVAPEVAGSYSITVSVSDNKASAVQASVAVTVEGGNVEPPFTNGLTGRYYKNSGELAHPVFKESDFKFQRVDPAINFEWGRGIPNAALVDPVDGKARDFNVRWTGHIRCDTPGTYSFRLRYDDGVRLFIGNDNGQLVPVIDGWLTGPNISHEQITLQGGKWYPIVFEYFEDESTAYVQLYWTPPGASGFQIVPTTMLRSD